MAREPFESLPAWRAAMRLSVLTHRLAAVLPAEEKSGLASGLKRAAQQPAVLVAQADAADEPKDALAALRKCEAPLRELLTAALLAQQLRMLGRGHLRSLRHAVDKLRRRLADEIEAWEVSEAPIPENENAETADDEIRGSTCDACRNRLKLDPIDDLDDDAIDLDAPPRRFWPRPAA